MQPIRFHQIDRVFSFLFLCPFNNIFCVSLVMPFPFCIMILQPNPFNISVPNKPTNLTVLEVTSTTIKIQWYEPDNVNDGLAGYVVYYQNKNQSLNQTSRTSEIKTGPTVQFLLPNLSKSYDGRTDFTHCLLIKFFLCPCRTLYGV